MYTISDQLLTPNPYSRPEKMLIAVKGIVVHWVANTMTSATANRNYFESRKLGTNGYGSAHYIIDLNGDVVRCVPEKEMAYHVGAKTYTELALRKLGVYPNNCTIGIECTHIDDSGQMSKATYATLVELVGKLLGQYSLDPKNDLYLHYDITGKICHKWFVENPQEWAGFKEKIRV